MPREISIDKWGGVVLGSNHKQERPSTAQRRFSPNQSLRAVYRICMLDETSVEIRSKQVIIRKVKLIAVSLLAIAIGSLAVITQCNSGDDVHPSKRTGVAKIESGEAQLNSGKTTQVAPLLKTSTPSPPQLSKSHEGSIPIEYVPEPGELDAIAEGLAKSYQEASRDSKLEMVSIRTLCARHLSDEQGTLQWEGTATYKPDGNGYAQLVSLQAALSEDSGLVGEKASAYLNCLERDYVGRQRVKLPEDFHEDSFNVQVGATMFLDAPKSKSEIEETLKSLKDRLKDPATQPYLQAVLEKSIEHQQCLLKNYPDGQRECLSIWQLP